jgi:hypothetical protein
VLQSLLLTALGGVLGIGGGLLASQWQAREARRVRREQYGRDDRYRLTTERIGAYGAFYTAAGSARRTLNRYTRSGGRETSLTDVHEARDLLWQAYTLVALIGDHDTERQASALLGVVDDVAYEGSQFAVDRWSELIRGFIEASRLELIPARNWNS